MIFRFMGVPREDWPKLRAWGGNRLALAWGRPTPEEQVHHAENMAAYRTYLRGLVAAKVADRGDDFCSALLEIHDEAPAELEHEEIASILFSLSFAGPRDDEQPDRQLPAAAARGGPSAGTPWSPTAR